MFIRSIKPILFILFGMSVGVLLFGRIATPQAAVRDGVFIHVSSGTDEPHRVLMALHMASLMAEDKDVLLYFDIAGINVVAKEGDDIVHSAFPSSKSAIQELLSRNVKIYACPACMGARKMIEEDLLDGVQVASKEAFFNFTEGRIITLDY